MSVDRDDLTILFERYGPGYRWLATVAVMTGTITVVLASTIVNVALPDIMGSFGIGLDKAQWLSTAFLAAMTAGMLLTSWFTDNFGVRPTFTWALAVFAASSFLGGIAPNEDVLILARVGQGTTAGIVQPLAMLMIYQVFPLEWRARATGIYGIGVILAPVVGPTVGGWLTDNVNWRYVFFMSLPGSILAIFLGLIFLPGRLPNTRPRRFDWWGLALLLFFLGTILTALANGQREGWNSGFVLRLFALAAASVLAFVLWQLRCPTPLMRMEVFANLRFSAGALVAFIFGAGIFGTLYLIPLFVQSVLGYTATRAGELLMPSGLVMGIAFPIAGRLGDMISPRIPIVCGLVVFGFSNILFYWADADTGFWAIAFWIILGRIGLSFIMPSLNAGALSRLPPELLGQGTGSINFVRQLGGALGVGMLSAYVDRRYAFHADAFASTQNAGNGSLAALRTQIEALLGRSGLPDTQLAGGTFDYVGKVIAAQANAASFNDGFAIAGLVFALAILPALIMRGLPHRRP